MWDLLIEGYFKDTLSKLTIKSVLVWLIIALVVGAVSFVFYRRGKIRINSCIVLPVLAFYLSFVITITLIERIVTDNARYHLKLFVTYEAIANGAQTLISEVFWNIVLFIPIGIMFMFLLKLKHKWLISIVMGLLLSASIEVIQLVTHRGVFVFDDMIHNTLGTVIGVVLYVLVALAGKRLVARHS